MFLDPETAAPSIRPAVEASPLPTMFAPEEKKTRRIRLVRLLSGEELVCEFLSQDMSSLRIRKPLQFLMQPLQNGKVKAGFAPWMPHTKAEVEESVVINQTAVVTVLAVSPEIEAAYIQTMTGLAVPVKKIIAP